MLYNSYSQEGKNSADNVFKNIPVSKDEVSLFKQFLYSFDFSENTRKAFCLDVRKFAKYFTDTNKEPFDSTRITTMDISGFKSYLRKDKHQAVATVNRALVSLRRYLEWLEEKEHIEFNPAKLVKELKKVPIVPRGLESSQVRKLIREAELRNDIRSKAIFTFFLHTGCRVSDMVQLELQDIIINDRSGSVVFRNGKGNKERQVPLALAARKSLNEYLEIRPPVVSDILFIGERGPLTDTGIRALCNKYSAVCGFKIYPHLLRHTFAHFFLAKNNNDIVALAQILGHENLNTSMRYTAKKQEDLSKLSENVEYC